MAKVNVQTDGVVQEPPKTPKSADDAAQVAARKAEQDKNAATALELAANAAETKAKGTKIAAEAAKKAAENAKKVTNHGNQPLGVFGVVIGPGKTEPVANYEKKGVYKLWEEIGTISVQ